MLLKEKLLEPTAAELVIFFHLRANSFRAAGNEMVFTLSITPAVYLMNSAVETAIFKSKKYNKATGSLQ